jgi:pantetheine-phosphate adenylyltransferase
MYKKVCVAGTFDGLHLGHEALLQRAFREGERVLIGITSDAYATRYKSPGVRSMAIRTRELTDWLAKHNFLHRATMVPINDPFEPAASREDITGLIVSEDSRTRGEELNAVRRSRGLPPLALIIVPMVHADDARPISATRIREGEIDKTGKLLMPDALRTTLAYPLGEVWEEKTLPSLFHRYAALPGITVGDMTTYTLLSRGITPRVMVIDHKVNRRPFKPLAPLLDGMSKKTVRVKSGPGFIGNAAIEAINAAFAESSRMPVVIEVEGEEDLLALPVVMSAPLSSVVYYGQPNMPGSVHKNGMVAVLVTQEKKEAAKALLDQFVTAGASS